MRTPNLFQRELAGWMLRGMLGALPSAFWAGVAGFKEPAEIAAMLVVVGGYIAGFAWFSASETMTFTPRRIRFLTTLKTAGWIKGGFEGCAALGWLLLGGDLPLGVARGGPIFGWLTIGTLPDLWMGIGSILFTGSLAGVHDPFELGQMNSFGWTGLTTVIQGALLSAELLLFALGLLGWKWLRVAARPQQKFFPAQSPG